LPKRWLVVGSNADLTAVDPANAILKLEKFRKWSNELSPTLDLTIAPDSAPPTDGTALPLQPTAKWLADFDEAERVGMAVRITAADCVGGQSPKDGVKGLYVVGVDWTQTPDASAKTFRELMYSHVYTDGLSAIAPGTPTNVTATARAGAPPTNDALTLALDPETRPTAAAVAGHASDRLWRDLGIVPDAGDLLTALPNGNGNDRDVTGHLINALWEGTLGLYASEFMPTLVNDATLADVRAHARNYLAPAGAYPALRIGKQPYGVLPVVAGRGSGAADTPIETWLLGWLSRLEAMWRSSAATRVPKLVGSSNVDADMNSLLQRVPVSMSYQYRAVLDRDTGRSTAFALTPFSDAQAWTNQLLWQYLSPAVVAPMQMFVVHPTSGKLTLPLVDPKPGAPGSKLSTNYLQSIADLARTSGAFDAIKSRESATTLLEALTANSAARELHRADMTTINKYLLASKSISAMPALGVLRVDPSAAPPPVAFGNVVLSNASQASRLMIASVTGTKTVRQFVTAGIGRGAKVPVDYHTLDDMLKSVEWLALQPADQIERCLRDVLDGFSFRLDAWITSMALRRLAASRVKTPTGAYIGAFGWIDDLHPASVPTSLGYIHTPSLAHAATAAVLRSGHLAHNDAQHQAFDVNLRSDRVRTATRILDSVSQGQPLAAVLGYQFERSVRDASLTLAQYIFPFRRLIPLRSDGTQPTGTTPPTASETIAARDVVDGVALLQRWQNERTTLLGLLSPAPSSDDQISLTTLLDALALTYDAVADTMVAEAVHQNVLGNNERAGAVLAALDRQETPPRMDFIRTPRSGKHFTHRVLLLVSDETLPTTWAAAPLDARANAEPRLNAWIARLLGDPAHYKFGATVIGSTTKTVSAALSELGLSPLALVMASEAPGNDSPSELEERVMHVLAAKVAAPKPTTSLTLLTVAPSGSSATTIGFGALRSVLKWIYTFITTHRGATANDLALPQDGDDDGLVATDVAARADALALFYGAALASLDGLIAAPPTVPAPLRTALTAAAAFGVRGALPYPPPLDASITDRDQLLAQARDVVATMHGVSDAQTALVTSFGAGTNASPRDLVNHHTDRIRALVGEHFPVLAQFNARNAAELTASLSDRATLLGGDDAAPLGWLQRMALVRPGAADLSRVVSASEMLLSGITPASAIVAQLPRATGEKWLALQYGSAVPNAELSIVAETSGAVDFTKPISGIFADAWPEVVPNRTETTGMTFHFDAPGARPPQSILIAVQPEPPNTGWSVNTMLESVMEARRLAPLRAVTPADLRWLGTSLPPIMIPAIDTPDVMNTNPGFIAANVVPSALANVLGKA
jgi:hypothetical protein